MHIKSQIAYITNIKHNLNVSSFLMELRSSFILPHQELQLFELDIS